VNRGLPVPLRLPKKSGHSHPQSLRFFWSRGRRNGGSYLSCQGHFKTSGTEDENGQSPRGRDSRCWPKGARPLGTRMRVQESVHPRTQRPGNGITCTRMLRTPPFIPNREKIHFYHSRNLDMNLPLSIRVQTTLLASMCHALGHVMKKTFSLTSILS